MPKSIPLQQPATSVQNVRTPPVFLRAVKRLLGIDAFVVDLAASRSNTVAKQFYSERSNALVQSWVFDGWGYCNPPFSDLRPWVEKAWQEAQRGAHTAMLVPAGVGANWWRDHVHGRARILLLNGRLTFVGHKQPYPKDCALLLYTPDVIPAYEIWSWQHEQARPEIAPGTVNHHELILPPGECAILLMTDRGGAEVIAGGILPGYIKQQARDALKLTTLQGDSDAEIVEDEAALA